ncbi:MAG: type IV pilin protein [Halioglobus sp.]|nr:type IV pilin protein [Halioglobus sp.]
MQKNGFSLIELLIAITVAAVLLYVALPAYREPVFEMRRALVRMELLEVVARQEQYFGDHKRYADSLADLGLPGSPYALDSEGNRLPASAAERIYLISLSQQGAGFVLHGNPQYDQAADHRCGRLGLSSQGRKTATGHDAGECW